MNWNLAERLPENGGCRNSFNAVIAGYINAVYIKMKQTESSTISRAVLSQPCLGIGANENVAEYAKEILSGEISQKLFQYGWACAIFINLFFTEFFQNHGTNQQSFEASSKRNESGVRICEGYLSSSES